MTFKAVTNKLLPMDRRHLQTLPHTMGMVRHHRQMHGHLIVQVLHPIMLAIAATPMITMVMATKTKGH